MNVRNHLSALACLLLTCATGRSEPRWLWEDAFGPEERRHLTGWIEQAEGGLTELLGELPFAYDVHFHRLEDRGEPVPWANTRKRGDSRAVKFYVDPAYPARAFREDWTASHELVHLLFPYLGRSGMWFAEGIASYLQYQVMYAGGVLPWPHAIERYAERFTRASHSRRAGRRPIVELPRIVRETRSYVRLYWGGAAYFLEADRRLSEAAGARLHEVIRRYVDCCFGHGEDAMEMVSRFDALSGTTVFSDVYRETVAQAGFPAWETALAWLAANPPPLLGAGATGAAGPRPGAVGAAAGRDGSGRGGSGRGRRRG